MDNFKHSHFKAAVREDGTDCCTKNRWPNYRPKYVKVSGTVRDSGGRVGEVFFGDRCSAAERGAGTPDATATLRRKEKARAINKRHGSTVHPFGATTTGQSSELRFSFPCAFGETIPTRNNPPCHLSTSPTLLRTLLRIVYLRAFLS